jgi:hypothetical protein
MLLDRLICKIVGHKYKSFVMNKAVHYLLGDVFPEAGCYAQCTRCHIVHLGDGTGNILAPGAPLYIGKTGPKPDYAFLKGIK